MKALHYIFVLLLALSNLACAKSETQLRLDEIYQDEIMAAMIYAPPDKTKYQLRGDAQQYAQSLFTHLSERHGISRFRLPGIIFLPVLVVDNNTGAAGTSSGCSSWRYQIRLNEILFYRNYSEYMRMVIAHEVAHIAVCLEYRTEGEDVHGEYWESIMRKLGFLNPHNEVIHHLNLEPVRRYQERINHALREAFGAE